MEEHCKLQEPFSAVSSLLIFTNPSSLIGMELVGGKWRTISGVSYLFPVPLSYIAIAGIAYFVRGWSQLQLAITLPSVLLFGLWW
jgi:OCT family organic cation transporter-like MFS transporter 4/5